MKALPTIVVAGLCALLYISPVAGQGKFAVSVTLAPIYSNSASKQNQLLPDDNGQFVPTDLIGSSHAEGYSFGVMGRYAFSPNWSVSAGLWINHFVTLKQDISLGTLNYSVTIPNKDNQFTYRVPILINYQSSTKRLSPYFSAGALLNFRSTSYINVGTGQEVPVKFGKPVIVSPILGAGVSYRLNPKLSLIAQPTITYYLPQSDYIYYHSYQLRLQAQLLYTF